MVLTQEAALTPKQLGCLGLLFSTGNKQLTPTSTTANEAWRIGNLHCDWENQRQRTQAEQPCTL